MGKAIISERRIRPLDTSVHMRVFLLETIYVRHYSENIRNLSHCQLPIPILQFFCPFIRKSYAPGNHIHIHRKQ